MNSTASGYLRSLANEFGESTNAIRLELNRFEQAGLLESYSQGNKKMFRANTQHPMFPDVQRLIHKFVGIDKIIEKVILRLGAIKRVYITGDFANGTDSSVIDLLIVSEALNRSYLTRLIEKTEPLIKKKIRYVVMDDKEYKLFEENNKKAAKLIIYGDL